MKFSVVVPVYGCPVAINPLCERTVRTISQITDDYEIILVNDSCPRNSWNEIKEVCQKYSGVVGINLSRNFGQMKAILAGLDYATGDWVAVMDCDLQDKPEEILNLYKKAQEGYDVVFARRAARKDSGLKIFISKCFYKVYSSASGTDYDPALCNFSVSNRKVVNAYCSMREMHRAFVMYIKWMGFKQATIDVEHMERYEGKSGYDFKKRMGEALNILTSQSDKLLRIIALSGIVIALSSFIAGLVVVLNYFVNDIVHGWTSIICVLCFIGGLILTAIGIAGIYIGNIFMEIKHRPLYLIQDIIKGAE